ncbi:hypothetical protein A4G19_05770 [Pasteurellaceae bacterium Macca]|nr:hypothetical protein [Pasteurellaceae bacterium Macca]
MPDNNQLFPNFCVLLSQYRLIEISGLDAEKYLQGQLTCDVAKLAVGEQTLTCHCDPKGKMSALFRLYRHSSEQFFAIMLRDLLPEALVQLKKYAVFSKVTFSELDTPIYGTADSYWKANFNEKTTACRLKDTAQRTLFWGAEGQVEAQDESILWDLFDIQQGIPLLLKANQFELIPQATNLQQLEQAISFTKGCYIGQETVARAKYRGANKRAMFIFEGDFSQGELPPIGGTIEMQLGENWKATGTILAAVAYQQQLWLQVVLNKEIDTVGAFRVGNTALRYYPLPYTLDEN